MVKKQELWTINKFAMFMNGIVKSDRQGLLGVSGETGSGKSTFLAKFFHEYGKLNGVGWSFDNMTWSRDEMMTWIDGEEDSKPNPETGLKPKQLPEYSGIMADELLPMFYSDNRFESDQQKAIATLNMCRDRHLVIGGAVPTFWDLTGKFRGRVSFFLYIPRRGEVWVFEKEDNAFSKDPWNAQLNEKLLRAYRNQPWKSPNYLCTIKFDDWEGNLKEQYYKIRNEKRLKSLQAIKKTDKEATHFTNKTLKVAGILSHYLNQKHSMTYKEIAEMTGVADRSISRWVKAYLESAF